MLRVKSSRDELTHTLPLRLAHGIIMCIPLTLVWAVGTGYCNVFPQICVHSCAYKQFSEFFLHLCGLKPLDIPQVFRQIHSCFCPQVIFNLSLYLCGLEQLAIVMCLEYFLLHITSCRSGPYLTQQQVLY